MRILEYNIQSYDLLFRLIPPLSRPPAPHSPSLTNSPAAHPFNHKYSHILKDEIVPLRWPDKSNLEMVALEVGGFSSH